MGVRTLQLLGLRVSQSTPHGLLTHPKEKKDLYTVQGVPR